MKTHLAALAALFAAAAAPLHAQAVDGLSALQTAAACAPIPASTLSRNPLRIVGAQDIVVRELYSAGTTVILSGGTARGVRPGERYFIRREPHRGTDWPKEPRGASTAGWLRVVSATETMAFGLVEFACDGILAGDILQPFDLPELPGNADRTVATGAPDFAAAAVVLFGDDERETGARGDFFLVDFPSSGAGPVGSRLAIYRDLDTPGLPLAPIGEAVVTGIHGDKSVVRITDARDAVRSGDLAVPRR
jgi:hypothetical protein